MPRLNAYDIPPSEVVTETKMLVDPDKPGCPWPLTLRAVRDLPGKWAIQAKGLSYADDYIFGRLDPETGKRGPAAPPLKVNGSLVDVSPNYFQSIAALELMQVPGETAGEDGTITKDAPYTFFDLVAFSKEIPDAFDQAVAWATGLMGARRATGDAVEDAKANP